MLRFFVLFVNFIAVVLFMAAIFTFGYWCVLTMNVDVPDGILSGIEHYLMPFLNIIRDNIGVYYQTYKGRQVEMTYGILVTCLLVIFLILLALSSALSVLDRRIKHTMNNWTNAIMDWKRSVEERRVIRTSDGNLWIPETGSALALKFENLEHYPDLEDMLYQKLDALNPSQRVFASQDKVIVTFPTTSASLFFASEFISLFKKIQNSRMLKLDKQPIVRLAVQSLSQDSGLMEEEPYLLALLNCVGPNEVYVGLQAKEQFEIQQRTSANPYPFKITRVGMYSQLGHRTFVDVFRLKFEDDIYKEAG